MARIAEMGRKQPKLILPIPRQSCEARHARVRGMSRIWDIDLDFLYLHADLLVCQWPAKEIWHFARPSSYLAIQIKIALVWLVVIYIP